MEAPTAIALRREPGAFTRSLTALILRLGLGMVLLFSGMAKFRAIKDGSYPKMIVESFPARIAFPDDVALFARALPYAEVGLGAALIAGFWTTVSAFLTGALLLVLLFGHLFQVKAEMYPAMMTYLLVDAAILWLSPVTSNYLSLDALLFGWFWRPRAEGEFRREAAEPEPRRRI